MANSGREPQLTRAAMSPLSVNCPIRESKRVASTDSSDRSKSTTPITSRLISTIA
jgi:hypothetical protein